MPPSSASAPTGEGICAVTAEGLEVYSCFTLKELNIIARSINNQINSGTGLCLKGTEVCDRILTPIDTTLPLPTLYQEIVKRISGLCSQRKRLGVARANEIWDPSTSLNECWSELSFVDDPSLTEDFKKKLLLFTFKPMVPPDDELVTTDLNKVMAQQEFYYNQRAAPDKQFKFLGATPCNFFSSPDRVQDLHSDSEAAPAAFIGVIFNTDPMGKPGHHWTSCFIDRTSHSLFYFDSVGSPPNACIKKSLINLAEEYQVNTKFTNAFPHQSGDIECGVYSVYFILKLLYNYGNSNPSHPSNSLNILQKNKKSVQRISDEDMAHYRRQIFNASAAGGGGG